MPLSPIENVVAETARLVVLDRALDGSLLYISCLVLAAMSFISGLRVMRSRRFGRRPRRADVGTQILLHQAVVIAVLGYGLLRSGWSIEELGLRSLVPLPLCLALGFCTYLLMVNLFRIVAGRLGVLKSMEAAGFEAMRWIWPRSTREKGYAAFGICVLNPVSEELMYRGVLVYTTAWATGNPIAAVVFGTVLSILAHSYQGLRLVPFHAVFASFAAALLFSPLGLAGAIGFHFAGDLLPVLGMRRQMGTWRAMRRGQSNRLRPMTPRSTQSLEADAPLLP